MDGLGSKEMAFDKFMIWLVAYVVVHTKHSLLSKGIYEVGGCSVICTMHRRTVISLAQFQKLFENLRQMF